jgi:organic radical activating enzyme
MCDIWKTRDSRAFHAADLESHLESIRRLGVRWVVLSGGEPLLNNEWPQLCSTLRQERIRLTLLTTGLLLSKNASQVAELFDDVIVSLDGPERIHDAIRRVDKAFMLLQRGVDSVKMQRPSLAITARTTVQKANHAHLRETLAAAKCLNLNGISFLAADLTSEAFNRPLGWSANRQGEVALSLDEVVVLGTKSNHSSSKIRRTSTPDTSPNPPRNFAASSRISAPISASAAPSHLAATHPGLLPWLKRMAQSGRASFTLR